MSYANFVQTQLAEPLALDGVTISLAPAIAPNQLPPIGGGILVLVDSLNKPSTVEIISYTSREGLILRSVERGQEGTEAVSWPRLTYCYMAISAGEYTAMARQVHRARLSLMLDLGF